MAGHGRTAIAVALILIGIAWSWTDREHHRGSEPRVWSFVDVGGQMGWTATVNGCEVQVWKSGTFRYRSRGATPRQVRSGLPRAFVWLRAGDRVVPVGRDGPWISFSRWGTRSIAKAQLWARDADQWTLEQWYLVSAPACGRLITLGAKRLLLGSMLALRPVTA